MCELEVLAEVMMRGTEIKQDNPNFQPLKGKTQNLFHRLDLHWKKAETEKRCNHAGMCVKGYVWNKLYPICEAGV